MAIQPPMNIPGEKGIPSSPEPRSPPSTLKNGKLDPKELVKQVRIVRNDPVKRTPKSISPEKGAPPRGLKSETVFVFIKGVLQNKHIVSTAQSVTRLCKKIGKEELAKELAEQVNALPEPIQRDFWKKMAEFVVAGGHINGKEALADELHNRSLAKDYKALAELLPSPEIFAEVMKVMFSHPDVLRDFENQVLKGS